MSETSPEPPSQAAFETAYSQMGLDKLPLDDPRLDDDSIAFDQFNLAVEIDKNNPPTGQA